MNGYGRDLALIAALIVINALFAGTEIALISLRESQLRRLRRRGGATTARLAGKRALHGRFKSVIAALWAPSPCPSASAPTSSEQTSP